MSSVYTRLSKFLFSAFLVIAFNTSVKSQVLVTGDLVFTGYHASGPTTATDQFSFVPLVNLPIGTVIKFTDNAWNGVAFNNNECIMTFTVTGAAITAGTEIIITPASATATFTDLSPAGTLAVVGPVSLPTSGDQIIAYQGTEAAPTFISGIHMNVETVCGTTTAAGWDPASCVFPISPTNNTSSKPAAFTTGVNAFWHTTEHDNGKFNGCGLPLATPAQVRAAVNNPANWIFDDGNAVVAVWHPTTWSGCAFLGGPAAPVFTIHPPVTTTICQGAGTSFTIAATGASTYQWQVDNGGGFANLANDATYSGVTTVTLNITNAPLSLNGYLYRCVATNGGGSTNSNNGTLNITALPVNPTLLAKTPATVSVADGTNVSATFNAGSGGSGCTDDYRYTTNGGTSYLPYTPGSNISTTGLAAGTGYVFIEGRRAGCATCPGNYVVLAAWYVTPLPAAATTLNAGDIAFSGYTSTVTDDFSFVLLRNIGLGTAINFTDNGWLSTNVFGTGEQTVTWTSNAAYPAGTEIIISGLTATLAAGGSAGTVTGSALSLITGGDQILAYRGAPASPTFISAIHMNVEAGSTAAAWDGTTVSSSASALPTGLTTGVNCIWIGTAGDLASEFDNARYGTCAGPGTLGPISTLRAALNNQANWIRDNDTPPGFTIPTGCLYFGLGAVPSFTLHPVPGSVCEGISTSFTVTATGAITYQWQVDNGGGFANLSNDGTYSGVTTTTLTITATPLSLNGYLYRCVATNVSGSTNSNSALLTVTALPVRPTLLAKTPAAVVVADGTPVSATFNAGSGGTGCSDDFRYTTDGGATYLPYTPGTNISTTGLAAGSGFVFIEGRRANCSAGCQGAYEVLAAWRVTPLPVAATTLNAGDIGFSGYASTSTPDEFSFVLLRNIGPGTVINFTDNGWLSTNVFGTGENTVTWTAPAGGLPGGTEIKISGLTATRSGAGAAGTVSGTALSLTSTGDQVLAYRGTAASPTFISAIHMNVEAGSTVGAWDGTVVSNNASALPTGLTSGVNCIWIGTPGNLASEFSNSRYGNCSGPGILGPLTGLRAALNNQANWISDDNTPPSFSLPTGCNYLLALCPTITVTNPANTSGTISVAFSETFTASGGSGSYTFTTASPLPGGLTLSTAGLLSGTPTASGTFNIVVTATDASTGCVGTGSNYALVVSTCGATAIATPSSQTTCSGSPITNIVFTGTGPTFNWVRDNDVTVTGIAASGTGDISGTLTNTTTSPVTVTFTITPTDGSCNGTPITATVLVNPLPSTANAGPDITTACVAAGSATMAANTPVVGTGTWTQTAGPITAIINTPGSPTTNITGMTTAGTYTFRWTISNAPCTASFDEVDVVVNPSPSAFVLSGGGLYCPGTTTLNGPVDPTYTYTWERSLSGIASPNSFTAFGGTAPAQVVSSSGNYRLRVTNQLGCSTTDTTVVNMADYVYNGSLGAGDAQQTGRLNRFGVVSTCAAPKACPGTFTTTGARYYDSYTITNPRPVPVCATIGLTSGCGTALFNVVYDGTFNPTALCTNYLADPGLSFPGTGFMEVNIAANATIVVVVHEVNPGTGCGSYTLTVDLPREPLGIAANPGLTVCNGAPVTLTASTANTYLWTPGGQTTQAINPTTTGIYGVTLGYGNNGCTANTSVNLTVENPVVNAVPNQYVCNGSSVTVPFTGTGATTYNWTNTNPAIGLPASGSGNLSFAATNSTGAPITGTVTVTPVSGSCNGTPVTFTITVANQPMITGVTNDDICAPGGVVNLGATGSGGINWFDALTGGNLVNSGNTYSPSITNTTTYYVESLVPSGPVTTLAMPAQSNTFPGSVRGYWFTAPADFVITSLNVPTTASSGAQSIAVVKFTGNIPPPVFSATTNAFTTVFLTKNNPSAGSIPCNIPVQAGEVIGLLGYRGNVNSYAPGDYNTTIAGFSVQLQRLGMQFPLTTTDPRDIWREFGPTTSISRIEFEYSPGQNCISAPRVPVTATVNELPVATATPSSQTVCSGPVTTIVLSSTVPGTTYAWTRDNTVNVTGIANSGNGDISGTLTNITTVPQTVTFTIIPTSPDGCIGAAITATVIVQAVPTITCPAAITVNNAANQCGNTVTYSATVTGIPVPTLTYTFTGATSGSGSGDGSGSFFNVGTTLVTITATNACGTASCSFNITVNDTQAPTITCPVPVTVSCASAIPAPNIGDPIAADNCPGAVVTHQGDVISAQTCANRYTVTRTYRVTDAASNFTECTQIITVNDQTPPVLTCPAPVTVSCASAVPPVNIAAVTGVSDNCAGIVTVTHQGDVISAQTCANRYTITRTYRATDVCGNFAECTQIITVNDQTPPVLTCPAPVTVSCAAAVPPVNTAAVTGVSDNCAGVVTVTHQGDVISAQTCANRFTITRTYRATDVCGNFAECTQIITVNDQTPPVLTCPAPVTVSCAAAVPPVNIASVTGVSDNCAGVVTVTHQGDVISAQTCANRFTITRTYRATDVCGNFAECTQIITVNDQTPPVVTCPAPVTVSCAAAVPAVNIASVTATDNCAGVITITHVGDVISNQTCLNRYTITRTYRATDVCGNSATCTQIITVNDQTAPVITCSPNLTATTPIGSCTAVVNFTVTATDNCAGPVTVVSSPASGSAFPIGVTTVTSTATDACGNSSTCTFTVTVIDGQLPVITSQPVNRTICSGLNASFSVTATNVVTYQWQQWNGTAWVNITGANAATFTLNGVTVSQNTNTYRVVLNGLCTVVNSNAATLYVNPPSTVTIAAAPPAILPNQTTTLTATGVPPGGTYAWTLNGAAVAGVTGAVLGPLNINQLGVYRVVYTSPAGCISTSADLTITGAVSTGIWVYPNPNFGQFQVRFYNAFNEAATINVYDALGQKIYQRSLVTGNTNYTQIDIDLGFKANGIYIVELVNGAGQRIGTKRINVQSK